MNVKIYQIQQMYTRFIKKGIKIKIEIINYHIFP